VNSAGGSAVAVEVELQQTHHRFHPLLSMVAHLRSAHVSMFGDVSNHSQNVAGTNDAEERV
jgi:hypothetical protein